MKIRNIYWSDEMKFLNDFCIAEMRWINKISILMWKSIIEWRIVWEWNWIEYLKWQWSDLYIIWMIIKLIVCDSAPCVGGRSSRYQPWEMWYMMWTCVLGKGKSPLVWCVFPFTVCYRAFFINLTDDLEELCPKLLFLRHGVRVLSSSSSVRPLMEGSTKVLMGHWCLLRKICIKCLTRD